MLLEVLGVDSYGLYILILGFVSLLSFLNGSLAMSTQRYTSFYLGAQDYKNLKIVFSYSVYLHLILVFIIGGVLYILTDFIFDNFLNIGNNNVELAKLIYYFAIGMTVCTILSVPFDAIINSKEDLIFYAITESLTSLFKFVIIFFLPRNVDTNLYYYALAIFLWYVLLLVIKCIWCFLKYKEIKGSIIKVPKEYSFLKEMISFSGWNILGALSMMIKTQGASIVLNYFWGTKANASYGIAQQVSNVSVVFSQTLLKSFSPQISKQYGAGNLEKGVQLAIQNSKVALITIILIAVPLLIETPTILKIWLHVVPDNSITFVRLSIILAICNQLSYGLMSLIQSQGNIRNYMLSVSFLMLAIIPISWFLYDIGAPIQTILVVTIIIEVFTAALRIYFANTLTKLPIKIYLMRVILPCILVLLTSLMLGQFFVVLLTVSSLYRVILTIILTTSFVCFLSYFLIFTSSERIVINNILCVWKRKK